MVANCCPASCFFFFCDFKGLTEKLIFPFLFSFRLKIMLSGKECQLKKPRGGCRQSYPTTETRHMKRKYCLLYFMLYSYAKSLSILKHTRDRFLTIVWCFLVARDCSSSARDHVDLCKMYIVQKMKCSSRVILKSLHVDLRNDILHIAEPTPWRWTQFSEHDQKKFTTFINGTRGWSNGETCCGRRINKQTKEDLVYLYAFILICKTKSFLKCKLWRLIFAMTNLSILMWRIERFVQLFLQLVTNVHST